MMSRELVKRESPVQTENGAKTFTSSENVEFNEDLDLSWRLEFVFFVELFPEMATCECNQLKP